MATQKIISLESTWLAEDEESVEKAAECSAAALVARVHAVKPFPIAAQKLLACAKSPDVTIGKVATILEGDPILAARVLRLANSAAFGLSTRCKSVLHAVSLLGPTRVAEVAAAAAVMDMFDTASSANTKRILDHSLAVAAIARRLAMRFEVPTEDVFTCALLHDVGKIMMLEAEQEGYELLLMQNRFSSDAMHVSERMAYGFDHAVLAGQMLRLWKIPSPVPDVVAWHHRPQLAYDGSASTLSTIYVLRLADMIAYLVDDEPPPKSVLDMVAASEAARALDLTADDLATIWPDLAAVARRGSSDAAPDSLRTSKRPYVRQNIARTTTLACSVCGVNTDGESCPRCASPLCSAHAHDRSRCCDACEAAYAAPSRERARVKTMFRMCVAASMFAASLLIGHAATGNAYAPLGWAVIAGFVAAMALAGWALRTRWRMRAKFLREPSSA